MIASAMMIVPFGPNTACITAVATRFCGAPWIPERGNVTTYARFASRYSVTTSPQPNNSARGKFFPGSRTSPAVNVTLFHADCAKSGPTIARPNIINNASTSSPCVDGSNQTCAAEGRQPFSHDAHHEDVYAALPLFQPRNNPTTISPSNAAVFVNVNVFWMSFPVCSPRVLMKVRNRIITTARSC